MPDFELSTDSIMGILDDAPVTPSPAADTPAPVETPAPDPLGGLESPETPPTPDRQGLPVPPDSSDEPAVEPDAKPAADPAAEAKPSTAPTDVQFDDEVGAPDVVERDGEKEWHWKESRARTIYAGYEESKKYREIAPTVEEATSHRAAYIDHLAMAADLRSNDPARVNRFLNYWGQQAPIANVAQQLLETSRTSNPEVYAAMSTSVLADAAERFYREYAALPNRGSEEAQRLLYGAQLLEWLTKGEYRQPDAIQAPDPVAERLADIQRRENAVRKVETDRIQAARTNFRQTTDSEIRRAISTDIEEALKPIAGLKKNQPLVYNAAVAELQKTIRSVVGADQQWNTMFRLRYEQALGGKLSDEDRAALVTMFRNRAYRAIATAKAKVINSVGKTVVQQSQETHQRMDELSKRKEAGGGAPSRPTLPNQLAGKDVASKINEILGI
jgi:hypothetical protein